MNRTRNNVAGFGGDMNGDRMNGNGTNMNGDRMNGNGTNMNGNRMNDSRNNGNMNGNRTGRNPNGAPLNGSLAEQIRALCFVKTELELYLDTHPRCRTALDYYYQTVEELKRLTTEYENTVGPLTAAGNMATDVWNWVDGPWPWQQAGDFMREGDR